MNTARDDTLPSAAYACSGGDGFAASALTRGPWHQDYQHAGPPIALACRAIEHAGAALGLSHLARLTANLLRPVPIDVLQVAVNTDYAGRNVAHFSATVSAQGKEVIRLTALMQREVALTLPPTLPGHPLPQAPRPPEVSPPAMFPVKRDAIGYHRLVENRLAQGQFFHGPCAAWFRLCRPLLEGETPSGYQRVAVAADSGNGISAILDFDHYTFVNADLNINFLRPPVGEWVCVDARTLVDASGGGLAESALYDSQGLLGRATQSLSIRGR